MEVEYTLEQHLFQMVAASNRVLQGIQQYNKSNPAGPAVHGAVITAFQQTTESAEAALRKAARAGPEPEPEPAPEAPPRSAHWAVRVGLVVDDGVAAPLCEWALIFGFLALLASQVWRLIFAFVWGPPVLLPLEAQNLSFAAGALIGARLHDLDLEVNGRGPGARGPSR